jgi:hypothetical protein
MSTLKTTNIQHPSAGSPAVELTAAGGLWLGGGKVLQVVNFSTTTNFTTTSSSFVDTNLTSSITPSKATSKVLVVASFSSYAQSSANSQATFTIVRGVTNLGDATWGFRGVTATAGNDQHAISTIIYLDSPATTSSTTYKVQARNQTSGIITGVGVNNAPQTLLLIEVSA